MQHFKYKKDDRYTAHVRFAYNEQEDEIFDSISGNISELAQLKCRRLNRFKDMPENFTISGSIIYSFLKKIRFLIIMALTLIYIYFLLMLFKPFEKIPISHLSHVAGMKNFLVWSHQCKIPNIDPYDPHIISNFKRIKYESCSLKPPLTNVLFNDITKKYTLSVNKMRKIYYHSSLNCCYHKIMRNKTGDIIVRFRESMKFKNSVELSNSTDNILVTCKINEKQFYINGHPMMPERFKLRKRLNAWKRNDSNRAPSILMIGIDNISRVNLIREMPKTATMLYNNEWFEMSGYNKIEENTFPNLIAILTGYNLTTAKKICDKIDNCPIIWKLFQKHGYVTAYGEDEISMSTFKKDFEKNPVDYYLKPFFKAANNYLKIRKKARLNYCLGYQHSADYVFDYAIELATRYKNDSFFGLFWTSSFSHDYINDCSSMDSKVVEYLEKLSTLGILNESVVIFFSDHGMRYGPARQSLSGYYEERLPYMFISLPQWLKIKYPEFVNGLVVNKNRLTNPFDIHMTLKHLLELSGRTSTSLPKALDCPNCQSLLRPVPYNRSCQDIAIADHWCTCTPYKSIAVNTDFIHKLALFVVEDINNWLHNFQNGSVRNICAKLELHFIFRAYQAESIDIYPEYMELYRILLRTLPGSALFEATIRHNKNTEQLAIAGKISRLNEYSINTGCISGEMEAQSYILLSYCHCPLS